MLNLVALFDTIKPPVNVVHEDMRFSVQPIQGYERYRLGKSIQETPSLLISTGGLLNQYQLHPIMLEHLTIQYNVVCRVSRLGEVAEEGRFTIISCRGVDKILQLYFLRVIDALVMSLGSTPSQNDITQAINQLVELFRTMTEMPKKSIQGLWAELFLIVRSRNVAAVVEAWHVNPNDRYDFSSGRQRIEVKSTGGKVRQHHFTLEQLSPPPGTQVLIASMFVEHAGGGTSVMELVEKAKSLVCEYPKLLLHLDRITVLTLGEKWRDTSEERFDSELAESSLAFFEVSTVPAINRNIPPGVSDVHFKSDLTICSPVNISSYNDLGGLFQAILRKNYIKK